MKRFALLLMIVLLAACSGGESAETDNLIIYSGRSESLVGPIIEQFKADTGINVEVRWGSTSEMAALLLEEGERSPADIFYAQDPADLGALANAGMLSELPDEVLSLVPAKFASIDKHWVGITGRARTVVYNTTAISDPASQLPDTIEGFTDPAWRGKIGWAPTNGSFQAMVTAMRTVWGEERTADWLAGIQANEPIVYEKNTPTVAAVGAGEVEVGFVNHYYLYRFLAEEGEGFGARNYFLPGGGPGSLVMVSGAGVLNSAENHANAITFLNYMLNNDSQQYFADETVEYPVIDGVTIADGLPTLDELSANSLEIDASDYTDLSGTVDMLRELGILP